MMRDIGIFGLVPAGIAGVIGIILALWFGDNELASEGAIGLVCFGWFVFLGLPLILGILLARAERNRYKNPVRNAGVAGLIAGVVSVIVMAIVVFPVTPIISLGLLPMVFVWFTVGAMLGGISAALMTAYQHNPRFVMRSEERDTGDEARPS